MPRHEGGGEEEEKIDSGPQGGADILIYRRPL